MTPATVGSELAVMDVIGTMTVGAVLAQARLHSERLSVTALARDIRVRTVKREARLLVVIEQPLLPFDRVVAKRAIFTEAPLVRVVFPVAADTGIRGITEYVRVVTLATFRLCVPAQQRKTCEIVIEEDIVLPRQFAVAVKALRTLRPLMGVIVLMARETVPSQFRFEDWLDVAGFAFSLSMRADQCVFRVFFMIEMDVSPTAAGVAGLTGFAEVAFVIVVLQVAGNTGRIEFIGERVLAVAAGTFLFGMLAVQQEIRVAVVIETGVVPAFRAVTVSALVAAAPFMRVVLGMTVVALGRRVLERVVLMAIEAGGLQVFADQRISGRIMIEFDVLPFHRRVTIATRRAQRPAVRIVFFVTRVAIVRRVAVLLVSGVARGAFTFGVFAEQWKVREFVVEVSFVELHDIGVAALVIGMTPRTGGLPCSPRPSVEAGGFLDVLGDVLVAVKAQRALFAPLELLVAQATLALVLRVALDQFTRHDQGFDLGMGRFMSDYRQRHQYSS
jgi:hypothetical protein